MAKEIIVETQQDVVNATAEHPDKKWYMLQVASNCEQAAIRNIKERLKIINADHKVGFIFFAAKKIVEMKNGQKKYSLSKNFPSYIFILADLNEEMVTAIHSAGKVMKFADMVHERLPKPLREKDYKNVLSNLDQKENEVHYKVTWEEGETITINEGPFTSFNGTVKNVNYDKQLLTVSVMIFGRETPVELLFTQVGKYKEAV